MMMRYRLDIQFFSSSEEKTEKPTPKKKQDARKKGQVAKSSDVSTALSLLVMFLLFWYVMPLIAVDLAEVMRTFFTDYLLINDLTIASFQGLSTRLIYQTAMILAPILALGLVIALLSNYMQFGFLFSTEAIQFKLEKINPLKGFKKIFALRAIVELFKSLLKILLVGLTAFFVIWINKEDMFNLPKLELEHAIVFVGKVTLQMGLAISILLIFLSILDLAYQRYDHEKNLKMGKQEVKDEGKKMEGDPQIKAKIKEKQRQMAMQRMMQEVPNADVVITNPTHYAVALSYQDKNMDAPKIVAKGTDHLALKIKEVAKQHNVVVVEKRQLARALYHQLETGDYIPETFFKAVAEVLAYVYQVSNKLSRA